MKAAFQGLKGAYSEAALRAHFGPKAQAVGFPFSEQVFDAVETGIADAGIVPVENSIAGPVGVNVDLLLERSVYAVGESYLKIEHCLLGRGTLKDVKLVRSHPVALAQCRDYLQKHKLAGLPEYDTAGAAELVARMGDKSEAAIASRECAEAYGLSVLAENIQTVRNNYTKFLAFVRADRVPAKLRREKTSLAFAVKHQPGALLDALKRFADRKLNLSKLESRPIPADPFEYVFFADVLAGEDDAGLKAALEELKGETRRLKVLGSYALAERPKP